MSRKNNRYRAAQMKRRRNTLIIIAAIALALIAAVVLFLCLRGRDESVPAETQESWNEWSEWDGEDTAFTFGEGEEESAEPETDDEGWQDVTLLDGLLEAPETPAVLAEFEGGAVMSDAFVERYNEELTDTVFLGEPTDTDALKKQVLTEMAKEAVQYHRAETLGLTQMTDADRAEMQEYAASLMEDMIISYMNILDDGSFSEDDLRREAIAYMENEDGYTAESILADVEESWWMTRLYNETVKGITVPEDQLKAYYDSLLEEQKQQFTASPEDFEYAHIAGDPIVYRPAGYRAVKNLLIPIDKSAQDKLLQLEFQLDGMDPADETYLKLTQQESELFKEAEATAEEIVNRLAAGESFESLADRFNKDEDTMVEPLRSEGYYVAAGTYLYSDEFVQGSLELTGVGEVSSPLRSFAGVHLVQYLGDVPEGEVPFEQVRDQLATAALDKAQDAYFEEQSEAWLEAANVQYHPENLN